MLDKQIVFIENIKMGQMTQSQCLELYLIDLTFNSRNDSFYRTFLLKNL